MAAGIFGTGPDPAISYDDADYSFRKAKTFDPL